MNSEKKFERIKIQYNNSILSFGILRKNLENERQRFDLSINRLINMVAYTPEGS